VQLSTNSTACLELMDISVQVKFNAVLWLWLQAMFYKTLKIVSVVS